MIGADQPRGGAALGVTHPAAAVTAGVVEGADPAVAAAHDHHRIVADLYGEEGAWLGDLAIMPDEQPVAIPDQFHVQPEEIRIDVEGLLKGKAVAPLADQPQHLVACIHVRPRIRTRTELVVIEG